MNTNFTKHNDPIPRSTFPHPKLQQSSNMLDEKFASATISKHMYLFLNQTLSDQSHACSVTTTTVPAMLDQTLSDQSHACSVTTTTVPAMLGSCFTPAAAISEKDEVCFINSLM